LWIDKLDAKFVISAAVVIVPVFAHLCNACFKYGIFPHCLKTAKVVPIHKSGDKNTLTNYMPISLLSVFSKVLEKLVYIRTNEFLKSHSVLAPTQYGFRANYSIIHAILDIIKTCYDSGS